MSGKKASEVNELLRNAERTRTGSMSALENANDRVVENTETANEKAAELKEEMKSSDYNISDEAMREFEKNSLELKAEITKLRSKIEGLNFKADKKAYDSLMIEYRKVDEEAEVVRKEVQYQINRQGRSDPWYCDAESAHAKSVQEKYRKLSEKTNRLSADMSGKAASLNSSICTMDEYEKQAERLAEMVANINRKAKDIVKLRAEASSAKTEIQKEFADISKKTAEKFMKDEYNSIKREIDSYMKKSDNEVIADFSKMTTELTEFINALQVKYAAYLERQSFVRGRIEAIEDQIGNKVFSNPEDEFKSGKKEMFSLIEFNKKYGQSYESDIIKDSLSEIRSLFDKDDFDAAEKKSDELTNMINKLATKAALIHENKMKTIFNMLSIKKAMLELHYDVDVRKNADDKDGYCISCSAGDECIKFDKVTVVDDGKPIITIDHKEATNGTCAASWHDIRKKLSNEGLFIEDIKKDGESIHDIRKFGEDKKQDTAKQSQ